MSYIVEKQAREIKNRIIGRQRIESLPKIDLGIFKKKGSSKGFRGWFLSRIKPFIKFDPSITYSNLELCQMFQEIYKKYVEFEKIETIKYQNWRGKGEIKVFTQPDKFIVEFASRREKGEKPKITKKEYSKKEVNEIIVALNKLNDKKKISSRELGQVAYNKDWDTQIFCKRPLHEKFTHLLNILEHLKVIKYYRSGNVEVLNPIKEIHEILK